MDYVTSANFEAMTLDSSCDPGDRLRFGRVVINADSRIFRCSLGRPFLIITASVHLGRCPSLSRCTTKALLESWRVRA